MIEQPSIPLSILATRLPQARAQGDQRTIVRGITHDSRLVKPGDLFVCLAGAVHDGHRFGAQALEAGAVALLVNEGGLERARVAPPARASILAVPDTRKALPLAACALYGDPSHTMTVVGVTGTNGKTTTTHMVAAILRASGQKVGTIGTLGAELDGRPISSEHTTPEADQLQGLLAQMREGDADAVVMEVSSHALAQNRTDGIAFSAGIFTNLTQDHLDFHGTMDAYFSAKARLFADYPVRYPRPNGAEFVAVINTSAWEGRYLVTLARGEIVTFALDDKAAALRAEHVHVEPDRTEFEAVYDSGSEVFHLPITLPVGGAFQVGNALAAMGACLGLGISWDKIVEGLAHLAPVPGRFEAVATGSRGFSVVVDYAHTPDGLENLLRSAQELSSGRTPNGRPQGRILLVFGCGGDRDRGKRPIMGGIAAKLADVAIVTSDNPRSEEPRTIIDAILTGMEPGDEMRPCEPPLEGCPYGLPMEGRARVLIEPDRREAIHAALSQAQPGDIVLIAGKGHEDYQIVGDRTLPFDDRQVAREWLARKAR